MPLRRSQLGRVASWLTVAAVVWMVVGVAVLITVGSQTASGSNGSTRAFNACISHTRFLVLTERRSGHSIIETIRDRDDRIVVGRYAVLPSAHAASVFAGADGTISGSGEMNGRSVLLTAEPMGRDAGAIQRCGGPEFPVAP